ncbi:hypothetical protein [Planctomyces sp. SH-PL62]|uniref:hypothetical protein n=1 Tax=Planctomyces sp. SH-PL62 TaxID=1636152 RepID=UPI00078EC280|nr:hypothetical protein [Planctomyces sp. SH-PL62]AMV35877.1 hypothetical protein VT85_00435 [Planctomyces sp. SH-PL62]
MIEPFPDRKGPAHMDPRTPRRPFKLATAAVALGLAGAAACSGCARDRFYTATPESGGVGRVVRRPALETPAVKPLFVGGYAGADYSRGSRPTPLRSRPMEVE